MAVYAEKRNGRTTGVSIAEVMHLGVRVRKRFDTERETDTRDLKEAKKLLDELSS
jgi:hypothetical protein